VFEFGPDQGLHLGGEVQFPVATTGGGGFPQLGQSVFGEDDRPRRELGGLVELGAGAEG
jgi:hypothetical protein